MELREAVRKRPGMFFGATDGRGVAQMILEVLSNSVDQHLVGRCHRVDIEVASDGTVTVDDDGPGIRTGAVDGMPPLVERLTRRIDRPTADGHRPHVHVGLVGVGLAAVNMLSERFEVVTIRDGVETTVAFERGLVVTPLSEHRTERGSGTRIRFRADPEIFSTIWPEMETVRSRIDDLSFVAPRLAIGLAQAARANDGMVGRLEALRSVGRHGPVAHHRGRYGTQEAPIDVEVAIAWGEWDGEAGIHSFVNLERTRDHGQHVDGLQDGVRAGFGRAPWAVVSRGLVAIVSVILDDVIFGNPARDRLDSPACRPAVAAATRAALAAWMDAAPDAADDLRARVAAARRARTAKPATGRRR